MKIRKYMLEEILEHFQIRGLVTIQEILDELKEFKDTEIIEEPKEELEELEEMEYAKAGDLMITIINKLIENQNKIIRELKANKGNE